MIFNKNLLLKLSYVLSINKEKKQIRFYNFSESLKFLKDYFQIQKVNTCFDLKDDNTIFEKSFRNIFQPNLYLKKNEIENTEISLSIENNEEIDFTYIDSTQLLRNFKNIIHKSNFIFIKIDNSNNKKNKELEDYFSFFNKNNFQLFIVGKKDIYSITKIKKVYGLAKALLVIAIRKNELYILKDNEKNYKKYILKNSFN